LTSIAVAVQVNRRYQGESAMAEEIFGCATTKSRL
jgi:hypothetical protein